MATVTAAQVKELREKTGAGMLDCKNALVEAEGDLEAAIDNLRKKGLSAAAKKSGRITSEGLVASLIEDNVGVLLEVNCETDFVSRNEDFQKYVVDLTKHIAKNNPDGIKAEDGKAPLMEQKWIADESKTVSEITTDFVGRIGENISPRRFARWECAENGMFHSYIHMGGKLGVLVELGAAEMSEAVTTFAKQVAMQIAASSPITLDRDSVPEDVIARERAIYLTQFEESGKPANLADRIIDGKMGKFYKENCLLEQEWVHESKLSVSKAMAAASKEAGTEITLRRFLRWQVGEGLEKRSNDLVAEVAEQLKGK